MKKRPDRINRTPITTLPEESDLDEGINLQLLLYLASLLEADQSFRARLEVEQNGRILPAGVLYYACLPPTLSLSAPLSEEELRKQVKGKMSRSGLFLLNEEVLAAMDLSQDHRFLPLVKAKDPKNNPPKNLKTENEWQELFDRLKQKVSEISERMLAGHIEAMPLIQGGKSSVCEWCAYRHLCRKPKPKNKEALICGNTTPFLIPLPTVRGAASSPSLSRRRPEGGWNSLPDPYLCRSSFIESIS